MTNENKEYKLTIEEKKLLTKIDLPCYIGGVRVTRPIIIGYCKDTGLVAGASSLKQWRGLCKQHKWYAEAYRFELRNLW